MVEVIYRRYLQLEHSLVISKSYNCKLLLYGLLKHPLSRLQSVQNAAATIIKFTRKYDYITTVLFELHWLAVRHHVVYKILLLVFKALNGAAPCYLENLLHYLTSCCTLRSFSQRLLAIPSVRLTSYGYRAFEVVA